MSVVQAPVGLATTQADRLVSELVKTGSLGQREAERLLGELRTASDRAQGREVRPHRPRPIRQAERDASGSAKVLAYDEYGRRKLAGGQAQL